MKRLNWLASYFGYVSFQNTRIHDQKLVIHFVLFFWHKMGQSVFSHSQEFLYWSFKSVTSYAKNIISTIRSKINFLLYNGLLAHLWPPNAVDINVQYFCTGG